MSHMTVQSEGLTLSEYADAVVTWWEFHSRLPIWARPGGACVTADDIALWEIETDILLLDEVV